jgi:hypothetical protein
MNEPEFTLPESVTDYLTELTPAQREFVLTAIKFKALSYAWEFHQYLNHETKNRLNNGN